MKCHSLVSGKNKKNINLSSAENAHSMVSANYILLQDTDAVTFAARLNGSTLEGREIRVMQCQQNPTKSVVDRNKTISF